MSPKNRWNGLPKTDLRLINVYELALYPMFREEPARPRDQSLPHAQPALGRKLHGIFARNSDPSSHPNQQGRKIFRGICGVSGHVDGSVMMCNKDFHEGVSADKANSDHGPMFMKHTMIDTQPSYKNGTKVEDLEPRVAAGHGFEP